MSIDHGTLLFSATVAARDLVGDHDGVDRLDGDADLEIGLAEDRFASEPEPAQEFLVDLEEPRFERRGQADGERAGVERRQILRLLDISSPPGHR